MARQLIVLGLLIAAIGAVMALGVPLGRLPGDFTFRRDSFSFYFPLTTSILISVVLTIIFTFWGRR
jgi:formate hydrogenlyase subunit 3/multisubunit Na+/H+ antiporter MnhD subunit